MDVKSNPVDAAGTQQESADAKSSDYPSSVWIVGTQEFNQIMSKFDRKSIEKQLREAISFPLDPFPHLRSLIKSEVEKRKNDPVAPFRPFEG